LIDITIVPLLEVKVAILLSKIHNWQLIRWNRSGLCHFFDSNGET